MAVNDLDVFGQYVDITGVDLNNIGDALKVRYHQAAVELTGYTNNPLYGMLPKSYDFGGRNYVIDIWHTGGGGVGPTMASAQVRGDHENDAFVLTRTKKYATNLLSGDAWEAARSNAEAMFTAYKAYYDAPIYNFTRDLCLETYRDGTGVRASFTTSNGGAVNDLGGATGTLTTITLDNADDVVAFERNQEYQIQGNREGADAPFDGADKTITAVDRRVGTVTFGAATATLAADTTYYIFRDGMHTAVGSANKVAIMGLQGWLPTDAELAASPTLFGVPRGNDTTRLGGLWSNGANKTITEAVLDAGKLAFREGARPDYLFLNPEQFTELQKEVQGKSFYQPTTVNSTNARVAYSGFKINAAHGDVTVMNDPNCPANEGFMLTLNTWKLCSKGATPHLLNLDGNEVLRAANEDAYEIRFGMYGNLGCTAPGQNVRISF